MNVVPMLVFAGIARGGVTGLDCRRRKLAATAQKNGMVGEPVAVPPSIQVRDRSPIHRVKLLGQSSMLLSKMSSL
jgi:hypothetical protein